MRGFWADERIDGKIWNLKNPLFNFIYRYFKRKEKQLLAAADHVITLTEAAKEIVQTWKLTTMPPITVIPCCADVKHFDYSKIKADDVQRISNKLGINTSGFILGYLGAIGTWYMLDEMLDFFKQLLITKPTAKFLFVTNEAEETIRIKANEKKISSDSILIQSATRNEVPTYISLMNVSIFFIRPTFSKQASSPTKMAELLSMGVPVICNTGIGDSDRIIEKTKAGIMCKEMNTESYSEAISALDLIVKKSASSLRESAIEYFSLEMGTNRYNTVYKSLTK